MSDDDVDVGAGTSTTADKPADDWQNVTKPGPHDVLCGRGGGTNNHSGNVKFRQTINEHKLRYLAASKVEKPKVAREVVKLWRALDPPGRFLARKDISRRGPGSVKAEGNIWFDVGDKKAREKASQCLRERTPDVLPYVREMQRQQDILTGQGLRLVEQQMRLRNESVMAQRNGIYPTAAMHSISEPDISNAFSVEHFFTHGFNNLPTQGTMPAAVPDDPLSLQQLSRADPQSWEQSFPNQTTSYDGTDLEPVPLPPNFQKEMQTNNTMMMETMIPDHILSGTLGDDDMTLEEYLESMKEYKALLPDATEERLKALDAELENSWVRSFHSIEHSTGSVESLSGMTTSKEKKRQKAPDSALRAQKFANVGQSQRSALSGVTQRSAMSALSERSKKSNRSAKSARSAKSNASASAKSAMSGLSLFSEMTDADASRSSMMSAARGLTSNLSMMSDITDLSEGLSQMGLETPAAEKAITET